MHKKNKRFFCKSSPVLLAACYAVLSFSSAQAESGAKALFYNPNSGTSSGVISGNVVQAPGGGSGGQFKPASGGSGGSGGSGQAYTGVTDYYAKLSNPGMHYWIELSRPGSSVIQRVSDRRVFRTGEKIRIHLSANSAGTILVNHTGSSGRDKTFPVATKGGVTMGKQYVIPSANGWLRFDHNTGTETIRLVLIPGKAGRAHAGASGAQFNQLYDSYSQSKSLVETVVEGTKDLVLEGASGTYTAPTLTINRRDSSYYSSRHSSSSSSHHSSSSSSSFSSSSSYSVSSNPGRYVVNTAGEPVALEIKLKHQ